MLLTEGLRQYVEPHTVQRELSEVTGLTPDELDHAAHELIRRTASDPTSFPSNTTGPVPPHPGTLGPDLPHPGTAAGGVPPGTGDRSRRPPYSQHLGGYSFDELKDYNRHSSPLHDEMPGLALRSPPVLALGSNQPQLAAGGWGRTSTATAAAAAAFRAGDLRARINRSQDFPSSDYDADYGGPIYTTSV